MDRLKRLNSFIRYETAKRIGIMAYIRRNNCNNTPNPEIIRDGYSYHFRQLHGDSRNLVCSARNSRACFVTAVIENGVLLVDSNASHTHPEDPNLVRKREFIEKLFLMTTHHFKSIGNIYNDVAREFRDVVHEIPFWQVKTRMQRWRSFVNPPEPYSYLIWQETLRSAEWKTLSLHDKGLLYMSCITAADGCTAAVYGDPGFAQAIPEIQTLHIITSERTIPNFGNTKTVLTLTAEYENYAFTFGWGFFDEVTPSVLRDAIEFIRRELVPTARPTMITTNLDSRLRTVIGDVWVGAQVYTTFHQFLLAVLHQANQIEGIDFLNEYHLKVLRKLVVLSWLPPESIQEMFEWIRRSIPENLKEIFDPLFDWYDNHFMRGLGPVGYSFYGKPDLLSNVTMQILIKLGSITEGRQSPIWNFYRKTLSVVVSGWSDLEILMDDRARNIRMTPRIRCCINETIITHIWVLLEQEGFTKIHFLSIASYIVRDFFDATIRQRDYISGQFLPHDPSEDLLYENDDAAYHGPSPSVLAFELEFDLDEYAQLIAEERLLEHPRPDNDGGNLVAMDENLRNGPEIVRPQPYNWRCIRCDQRKVEMMSKPCNCVALCRPCEEEIRNVANLQCPLCLERATNFDRIYIEETGNADDPYDWTCQICRFNIISESGEICGELKSCKECSENTRRYNPELPEKCPFCNLPGRMFTVNFRPIVQD